MKHHSQAINYSDLDFEAIQKEMMADKDTERAKANGQAKGESKGEGPKDAQVAPLDEPPADPLVDQATDPNVIDPVV